MAISPTFPTRKRPTRTSSFHSSNLADLSLLHSLLHLTDQICSTATAATNFLLSRTSSSTVRKTHLLGVVFEDLLRVSSSSSPTSSSLLLCLEEMYIVLHRIKTLIEDCSNQSKFSFLMQIETVADSFHKLTGELSTLLDIFPLQELVDLNDDVRELVLLIRRQCSESKPVLGAEQSELRNDVVSILNGIKSEIVPDQAQLASIFEKLEIRDSSTCRSEIESLQREIHNRSEEEQQQQSRSEIVALIGLVRYAKCVLFGASTPPRSECLRRKESSSELSVPADYRCPISLELMRDPVVVATGQTYDRVSIKLWMDAGHNTCPKTGQILAHTDLIPNHALRNMIALWCREQRIPFDAETVTGKINGGVTNKTALEATKMMSTFLVNKLNVSDLDESNAVVYELRVLAKTDSDSRACIAEAGAIPVLVRYLTTGSHHPSLQVNAVTTILNLSILEANKTRIMETDGALNGVAEVLRSGATWEAKANAAATVFSLTGVPVYRKKLGRKMRVLSGLVELAKCGPEGARRDALAAILNLAADRETVGRLVEGGAVEVAAEVMAVMPEEAVTILEAQVVAMVLNSFPDQHPRVRWAAINAIGQLSTDLGPDLQVKYHQGVLPALASAMDDFQNPRVQAHAASAVLNFTENCTPDILTPYLDGIVSKLLVLLQNGKQMVQEGALTALASVADSSQEHFQKYYDAVMPYLKAILVNATDKSNRMLRAKSMECISLVGMAVGKEKFRADAKQVMEVLMSLQVSQMETDDPTTSYMLQAWARLCKCLGQDFLPYMEFVMPPLIQSASLKPDVTITSADSDNEIEDSDDESMETITLGDKRIGIKTSVLEEKATACNMLCCYADELKEGFFPWIDQVAGTLVPLLKFYFHEEVRKAAVSAMPELLRSAKLAIEKGLSQGRDVSYLKFLTDSIIPALVEALHKEPDTEICGSMLESLNECLQISGMLLDESQVRSIVDEIKQVITASSSRKTERAERAQAEDFDAEEVELIKEENEQEEEVFDQVGEILGTLIKTFKASFLPFFDQLSSYLTPMWGRDKTPEERRIAICIFDDVAEQCREAAVKYYDTYLPFLLEACNDETPDVRQAAVYGLGVCAEFGGSVFKPLVGEALSRLNAVIQHPNALQSDNVMAYDNAVSALGKICQFHRDSIDSTQVVPAWLNCLPIKGDLIEAKVVHDQLCSMAERSDRELLGPNNQYLPKIVSVFAEVLCAGKDLATEQTAGRMINLLRQLQQTLPPATLASTWSSLQPQQQLALQSILSS